jgi:hypothetical protein
MAEPRCDKCKFWDAGEEGTPPAWGVCRRFPKIVLKERDDWCGEFSRKDQDSGPPLFGQPITDIPTDILTEHLATLGNKPINMVWIALINAELRSRKHSKEPDHG